MATTVLITHRLANVRHADAIYVMHQGRVVETGSHRELLANRAATPSGTGSRRPATPTGDRAPFHNLGALNLIFVTTLRCDSHPAWMTGTTPYCAVDPLFQPQPA